jgi:hypothetical protein
VAAGAFLYPDLVVAAAVLAPDAGQQLALFKGAWIALRLICPRRWRADVCLRVLQFSAGLLVGTKPGTRFSHLMDHRIGPSSGSNANDAAERVDDDGVLPASDSTDLIGSCQFYGV